MSKRQTSPAGQATAADRGRSTGEWHSVEILAVENAVLCDTTMSIDETQSLIAEGNGVTAVRIPSLEDTQSLEATAQLGEEDSPTLELPHGSDQAND
jgi:hypothetical protein